ncbi:MAG: tetratricopeptide repeat protein [Flammeovirgaceae bacterium]
MAKRIENTKRKKKQVVQQEAKESAKIYESAEALQDEIGRTQEFLEKNKKAVGAGLTALLAVVAIFFAFKYYQNSQNESAQQELFPAVFYFEKDSLGKALDGDGNTTNGLLAVADEYGISAAGNLTNVYIGMSYLKKGEYDNAIEALSSFNASDYMVQARVYSLLGDAYMEKEDLGEAISYYEKAASYKPNKQFTPEYLMKLALAHELNNDNGSAKEAYEEIIRKYPSFSELNQAKKFLARLSN